MLLTKYNNFRSFDRLENSLNFLLAFPKVIKPEYFWYPNLTYPDQTQHIPIKPNISQSNLTYPN